MSEQVTSAIMYCRENKKLLHKYYAEIAKKLSWKCRRHVGDMSATCRFVADLDPTCVSGPTNNSKIAEPTQNLCVGYPYIRTCIYVPEYNTTMIEATNIQK
jgi:hypothetical protein